MSFRSMPSRHRLRHRLLLACVALPALAAALPARADTDAEAEAERSRRSIIVTGAADRESASATGLALTLRETPQSLTVIDNERITDFALTSVNDLLDQTVGINVERVETDRTMYNARGFDISNFQVDGIGLPLRWAIQFGDLDTVLYERVEALRGANALLTGIGNPSATINYVRKAPTQDLHVHLAGQLGSWDRARVEGDVSGPLNASGTVTARLVYAHEERDSYLRYNHVNRDVYGAILAWAINPELTATVGYTRQDNDADGVLWGALPLTYSDGSRVAYPTSASPSADWTYWNVHDQTAWGELAYRAASGWKARGRFTYTHRTSTARLLYAYGNPDPATGLGVSGAAGQYRSPYDQYLGDFLASGPFTLFGRQHELSFGLSTARFDSSEYEASGTDVLTYPSVELWKAQGAGLAEPAFGDSVRQEDATDRLTRVYGAAHLTLSDRLKAVVGASAMWLKSTGTSYGADQYRKNSRLSPYVGAVYELTPNISVYASYTDIYNPQKEVDSRNRRLDPAKGSSLEGGIKSEWFDKRLAVSAALFRARQKGLAEAAGQFGAGDAGKLGDTYYRGVDTTSRGFEIELAGRVTDRLTLSGGYTGLKIEDEAGDPTRVYLPTKSLKLAGTYSVPEWRDLKLGAQLRWQNRIRTPDYSVRQSDYAVLDLMAGIRVIDRVRAAVNVRNVTNRHYLGSLMWGQAYYAAPRSVLVTLRYDY